MEDRAVQLAGWKVEVGATKPKRYAIDWITQVGAHETVRSYQNESTVTLSNGAGHIGLVNPNGVVVSSIDWDKANENEIFKPQPFLDEQIQGDVVSVLDTATVTVMLDPASEAVVGEDLVTVHMLGVELPEQTTENLLVLDDGYEFTSVLLESKKIELIFDTIAWTRDGELQAYLATDDDLRLVEEKLLEKGLVQVSGTGAKVHRQEFLEIEDMAKRQQLGLWAYTKPDLLASLHLSIIPIASATGSSLPLGLASVGSLKITEVFAAPDHSDSDCVTGPSTTGCEWIEIYNNSENMIDLNGWSVSINGKSKKITKSSPVRAQSYILLYAKQHKFALANDGAAVSLVSPSGTVIDTVTYPKTKKGMSYVISEEGACFVTEPSPGINSSCKQSAKEPLGKTKSTATSKAKKTSKTKAPYTLPISGNHESVTIQSAVESHPIRWLVAGLCVGFALCLIVMRKWAKA
jgi:endonuclease YncB( thermonuclease family)